MEPSDKYQYYIIVDGHDSGRICYVEKDQFAQKTKGGSQSSLSLSVTILDLFKTYVPFKDIKPLTQQEAELLYAVDTHKERLSPFWEREGLDFALNLTEHSQVTVKVNEEWCQGVIRYIGGIKRKTYPNPIIGTFFGIELQGKDKGKGLSDGKYGSERHFTCSKNCGIFVPFTDVRPRDPKPQESPKPLQDPVGTLELGDRVTFFMNDDCSRNGMVLALEKEGNRTIVLISPDLNEKNNSTDSIRIPLESVIREELLPPAGPRLKTQPHVNNTSAGMARDFEGSSDVWSSNAGSSDAGSSNALSVNSVVEVDLSPGRTVYGTVRWIGKLPEMEGIRVGLELEEPSGVTDGMFQGRRMFTCLPKRGMFVKRDSCRPDSRFHTTSHREGALSMHMSNKHMERNGVLDSTVPGSVAPLSPEQVPHLLVGRMRGIQGHCNSCYMDSALFSLFSCSSVLDSLLFMAPHQQDVAVQKTLLQQIVNPLRSKGFVPSENVMKLRRQLQDGGHSDHTFTTEEKDPEEFLTLVMQRILCLEPLLKLSAGKKVQENYCYQIFLDQKHSLVLPTVQQLLEHSLHWSGLTLAEIPSCLILQMPRFGKKFKLFNKIIPSLELDISDLLSESPRGCVLCGQLASLECKDCFSDPTFGRTGFKQFCQTCSEQVHRHHQRKSHQPSGLGLPEGYHASGASQWGPPREKLQLFAVLCIETSHYVSFVRYGPQPGDWLFFDSMADREGDQDGHNIPQVQLCPEVNRYLQMSPAELANQVPREMEGVAKRLFCDAYMYLYQSPTMALYR